MDIPPLVPAANISLLFREHAFLDRFQSARRAGFSGVEFLYQEEIYLPSIRRALQEYGLKHVLANMQGSQDDKGLAAVAGRELEFRERFDRSLAAACQTQAQMLHVTAGIVQHHDMPEAREVFHRNMEWAGKVAAKAGIVLVIEAINQIDVPGYFLRSLEDAIGWCSLLHTHNVALLLDLYHAGRQRLPPQALIENALPWTRHLQIAGLPNRNEPTMDKTTIATLQELVRGGYRGWLGAEYHPQGSTEDGLGWLSELPTALDH
ncbi:hydroxypyruvate isomerase family protein [Herbaspirillum rubrisubalbicans]|uniref:hydroxypyruvate isomerase family protein n=1 Tax=Herbaspirillum rubrisubalbicans TaxID=80842 RepID=UPI0020A6AC27|nr:TIM barrel protein [Herbaspirillum rubrisubalbicans]